MVQVSLANGSGGFGRHSLWLEDDQVAIDARERAYRLFRNRADAEGAARTTAGVANDLLTFRSDPAVAAGWLQRARRGLEDRPGSPVIAWLDIVEVGSPATARWSRLPMS